MAVLHPNPCYKECIIKGLPVRGIIMGRPITILHLGPKAQVN